jgi:hypothetical protein
MAHAIKVRGRLSDPRHIELDQPVNDITGPVDVILQEALGPERTGASRTVFGLCGDLGLAPSANEIDEGCREMWVSFERDEF